MHGAQTVSQIAPLLKRRPVINSASDDDGYIRFHVLLFEFPDAESVPAKCRESAVNNSMKHHSFNHNPMSCMHHRGACHESLKGDEVKTFFE
jgi:hypothetical protein